MPNGEAEERIGRAEVHALQVVEASSLTKERRHEVEEFHVATELFHQLKIEDRALLVSFQMARNTYHPHNPDDEDGLGGLMKDMTAIGYWHERIKEAKLTEKLSELQRIILRERYGFKE